MGKTELGGWMIQRLGVTADLTQKVYQLITLILCTTINKTLIRLMNNKKCKKLKNKNETLPYFFKNETLPYN